MSKFAAYLDKSSELEKSSKIEISSRIKENENDIIIRRQNIRIYILFALLAFIIFMVLKELAYEYITIKRGGLNHFTLCENIPYDCY